MNHAPKIEFRERAGRIEARYPGRKIRVFAQNQREAGYRLEKFDVFYQPRSKDRGAQEARNADH